MYRVRQVVVHLVCVEVVLTRVRYWTISLHQRCTMRCNTEKIFTSAFIVKLLQLKKAIKSQYSTVDTPATKKINQKGKK